MSQYERELNHIVDEIFDVHYRSGGTDDDLANKAKLNINTVIRLGNRVTRFPRLLTVQKMLKAVGLKLEVVGKIRIAKQKAG